MTDKIRIALATPHRRHDRLEASLRERHGYDVLRIRDRHMLSEDELHAFGPRLIFFPHWSWMIPEELHAKFTCVIFHMTDLPYGRGGSPLQNLIVRGHKETVMSALRCVSELDAGPIYLKRALSLAGTAEQVLDRASNLMEDMIVDILEKDLAPVSQQGNVVQFQRRVPADGNIRDLDSPERAYDYIRMLDGEGYPPAFLDTSHLRLEFSGAMLSEDEVMATVRIRRIPLE